jgi:hypothetical protein
MHHDFLILGGAGLVGTQVVRHIVRSLEPHRIVVASLRRDEAERACNAHREEFGKRVSFVPAWGNLFVPTGLAETPRGHILDDPSQRGQLLDALYGNFEQAYGQNHLVQMIQRHRPNVIVDSVNTATGLSYQDVFDGAAKVRSWIGEKGFNADGTQDLETFLLSQTVPQIIRHIRFLHRATSEFNTKVYLKVGTTGTGGMGLNIPYTHSEDRPSRKLLAKNEAAFGHTGLLFLLARTPDSPIVKEVKPAAMIGYRAVQIKHVTDKNGNDQVFSPQTVSLKSGERLALKQPIESYKVVGQLKVPVLDTGENGVFTWGEFAAITALGQMEYITPEEIAHTIVQELRGRNTGRDIISALDSSVLDPSYKAGLVRGVALRDLASCEAEALDSGEGVPSIALGRLGPPELSKLLFEAALLKAIYGENGEGTTAELLSDTRPATDVAKAMQQALVPSGVAKLAPSIGIPVLLPDGKTLLRGPSINVPEKMGHVDTAELTEPNIDRWARKGWVDLRPENIQTWRKRVALMQQARSDLRLAGSAAANIQTFMSDRFELGEVVAWIFNNEMGGHRIK